MKKYKNLFRNEKLKKKILFSVFTFSFSALAIAQTANENYTYTKIYLSADGSKKAESVQYFDDLGRPKQTVQVKATPLGQDLVVPVVYDPLGRQTKSLLPVPMPTANLDIQNASENSVNTYYGVANAYSQQKLEASPLARPLEVAHPGTEWAMASGHTQKIEYALNKNADQVKKYTVTNLWQNATAVSSLPAVSFYNEKVLTKNTATDEDGNKTIEFKNGLGQTVLVRKVITATENADTYYIYNNYGHLVYVISPKAVQLISTGGNMVTQQILDDLCYQYKSDNKGRLVEKKLPGKGWEFMVYDRQNRLVLSQDAALRTAANSFNAEGWMFTKYDQFGRTVYTGFFANTGSRTAMQTALNNMTANSGNNEERSTTPVTQNGMDIYYTKNAFPTESMTIMSISYYDTYPSYPFNPAFPTAIFGKSVLTDQASANVSTRTLPVMTLVKNIEDHGWTKSYVYYDNQARAIGSHSINHLGGYTRTESDLDFAGVPLQVKSYHKRLNSDAEKIISETFTYDHQNRLLTHKHKIDNNTEEILAQNDYNELSQLRSKKVGGTVVGSGLQTVDYLYNIRGWMTQINNPNNLNGGDLFGYEVKYTNPENTNVSTGRFNGNIAEVDWKTSLDGVHRKYSYQYDGLNRLSYGRYSEPFGTVPQEDHFGESLEYDLNGNITHLYRNAKNTTTGTAMQIDNLSYSYSGNRLTSVTDQSTNYQGYPDISGNTISYDLNGNMKNQIDKGILNIDYNFLNLPKEIKLNQSYIIRNPATGEDEERNVRTAYTYRADGTKLRKKHTVYYNKGGTERTSITDYLDGFQYTINYLGAMSLDFVPTSEGYYNFKNNKYIYHYTDHLGNIRLSYFNGSGGAEVLEENNYYPFGLKHEGYNALAGNTNYNYQYNGKELQNETGMYDYGARFYMPDLGRWGVIDPLAEIARRFTPYHYGNNNPIRFIDPDGRLTMDNLGTYSRGSAVASFMNRNGFGEKDMPLYYSDDAGMMIRSNALGDEGQGGGGSPTFQFDKAAEKFYKENYPEFYNFVMNILPKIVNDKNFMSILSDTSGFSIEELTKMFKSDTNYGLIGYNLIGASVADYPFGIDPTARKNLVRVNIDTLNWFKSANRDTTTVEGITNVVQMIGFIGHEINHWGFSVGNNSSFRAKNLAGDPGDYFERKLMNGRQRIGNPGAPSDSFNSYIKQNYNTLFKIFNK